MQWYLKVLKNYVGFQGRASRKEYWMFALISGIISIVLTILENVGNLSSMLTTIYSLAVLLPTLAVTARRLHDIGKSGWFQLIGIIPIIGTIILIVFLCKDSQENDNQYGSNPKKLSL